MRRKEKRLLQIAGLLIAAILFLPNVGLWSLYRDKVLDNSPEREGGTGSAAAQMSLTQLLVRFAADYGVRNLKYCIME
ncbi:UNVERIFIED_CONTAM: hypothetical protein FKN15_035929 [Acipenser sinensis]